MSHQGTDIEEAGFLLADDLPAWSARYPEVVLAFIEVDCFGGTCLYAGFTCRGGQVLFRQDPAADGHVHLLAGVGITVSGPFLPFERRYFAGKRSG